MAGTTVCPVTSVCQSLELKHSVPFLFIQLCVINETFFLTSQLLTLRSMYLVARIFNEKGF